MAEEIPKLLKGKQADHSHFSFIFKPNFANDNDPIDEITIFTIANDIAKLDEEEKQTIAKAFIEAIEGAEVFEMKAISNTSILLKGCYV